MIVSPPFLPERQPNETEDQFLTRSMAGGTAGDGAYPVSFEMNWHGGVHLTAPRDVNNIALPVRAIADGTVAFVRAANPRTQDATHPQNYRQGWTDNGCVIIRHETDIGVDAGSGQLTSITFFSIVCHLKSIAAKVQQGQRIFRKQEIGAAGSIYGAPDKIHFEIVCDDDNVQRLVGRSDVRIDTSRDGRTDTVFGSIHFALGQGTSFRAAEPSKNPAAPVIFTTSEPLFVRMTFARGSCTMETLRADGTIAAPAVVGTDDEYRLYHDANERYPQSPSAGHELLRFGRVLGPDPLDPPKAPHWRRVAFPGGEGWVDLNGPTVRKFSDADFPHWDGFWMLVDGSASSDSRCRDPSVLQLLDLDHDANISSEEAHQMLNDPEVQKRLAGKICKFHTEWDAEAIDARFGWLMNDPSNVGAPATKMSAADFARFKAHASTLCFWKQAQLGIAPTCWHFNPKMFVSHFRKCGWLSVDELAQCIPRRVLELHGTTLQKMCSSRAGAPRARVPPHGPKT